VTEQEIYDGVIMNGTTDFAFVVEILRRNSADWCLIGGLAVNSYCDPVYTADCDLVVGARDLDPVLAELRDAGSRVKKRFPFSVNAQRRAGAAGATASKLMLQFTQPEQYQAFVERAGLRPVFGLDVPVASPVDLAKGKLWAWEDPSRREAKRSKDESDLLRLGELFPEVYEILPPVLRERLDRQRARGPETIPDGWGDDLDDNVEDSSPPV
jgi:hypothetical protein